MKTSSLARSEPAAQRRIADAGDPVRRERRRRRGVAVAALEFGTSEQLRQLRVIARGEQRQAVQHAADRSTLHRHRLALTGEAGYAHLRLIDRLDETEATAPISAGRSEQRHCAELAVDHASGFKCWHSGRRHTRGDLRHRLDQRAIEFATRPIDLELSYRLAGLVLPAHQILAPILGMPENLISPCLV